MRVLSGLTKLFKGHIGFYDRRLKNFNWVLVYVRTYIQSDYMKVFLVIQTALFDDAEGNASGNWVQSTQNS